MIEIGTSIKVFTDYNRFLEIEKVWNCELANYSDSPFLYSRLFSEFMHLWESRRWTPMAFTFWSNNRLVGVAALKMQKRFHSPFVCNLEDEFYSSFTFFDKYREMCITQLIDVLFSHLNCRSATITFDNSSPNLSLLEKICELKKLHFWKAPYHGKAIIRVEQEWDQFFGSLKRSVRYGFRRIERKLDRLGSWRVSCLGVDSDSVEKLFAVERMSWKNEWRMQKKIQEDHELPRFLRASQSNGEIKPIYDTEIWFLELNGLPIAYQLVLKYKGTAFCVKTSYDKRFKMLSPGKFLINAVIREFFIKRDVKKVDFITNLPFVQVWNPSCENRTIVTIERNTLLSATVRFAGKVPVVRNFVNLTKKLI